MIRKEVFLVDDHALVLEGLSTLINQEADLHVCGQAQSAEEAWREITRTRPGAAIVDISLRGESGLELVKRLHGAAGGPAILVLSMHDDAIYAERALRAGARGYVMKRDSSSKIIDGLRKVLEGETYVSESVAARLTGRFLGTSTQAEALVVDALSDRELEVFRRIGMGEENRQIAESLGISLKTIQTHCAHIKDKMGLANGTLLVREAVRWVEEERKGLAGRRVGPTPS